MRETADHLEIRKMSKTGKVSKNKQFIFKLGGASYGEKKKEKKNICGGGCGGWTYKVFISMYTHNMCQCTQNRSLKVEEQVVEFLHTPRKDRNLIKWEIINLKDQETAQAQNTP